MKSAKEMFEELGYELYLQEKDTLMYRCKKDYIDNTVTFHLGNIWLYIYDVSEFIFLAKRRKNESNRFIE